MAASSSTILLRPHAHDGGRKSCVSTIATAKPRIVAMPTPKIELKSVPPISRTLPNLALLASVLRLVRNSSPCACIAGTACWPISHTIRATTTMVSQAKPKQAPRKARSPNCSQPVSGREIVGGASASSRCKPIYSPHPRYVELHQIPRGQPPIDRDRRASREVIRWVSKTQPALRRTPLRALSSPPLFVRVGRLRREEGDSPILRSTVALRSSRS